VKVAPLAEVKTRLSAYLKQAQHDSLLITRHGRPVALVLGVEGESLEDLLTSADPELWRMIAARRSAGRTVSARTARRQLGVKRTTHTRAHDALLELVGAAGRAGRSDCGDRHDEIVYGVGREAAGDRPRATPGGRRGGGGRKRHPRG
jgi:prevent-host-death family protein